MPRRVTVASFKGSDAFGAWFDALVKHARIPQSSLIELAVIAYARQIGYEPEAPER